MKSFFKFLIVFGLILIASAVLAPFLYQHLPFKFEKIFNRLVMIFSLVAAVAFIRIRRDMFELYRPYWQREGIKYFFITFIAAVLVLSVLTVVKIALGYAGWAITEQSWGDWAYHSVRIFLTALLIGVIEEFFFRNFVFLTVSERWRWGIISGVLITSVFYSLIHFIAFEKPLIGESPTVWDSFRLMAMPVTFITKIRFFWPDAVGLFLFGLILNDLVIRTRSIYPSVGLHAGCVFFVKMDGSFVDFFDNNLLLIGSKKMYDGGLGWVFLVLMWILVKIIVKRKSMAGGYDSLVK